jgi:hypothetical protein
MEFINSKCPANEFLFGRFSGKIRPIGLQMASEDSTRLLEIVEIHSVMSKINHLKKTSFDDLIQMYAAKKSRAARMDKRYRLTDEVAVWPIQRAIGIWRKSFQNRSNSSTKGHVAASGQSSPPRTNGQA